MHPNDLIDTIVNPADTIMNPADPAVAYDSPSGKFMELEDQLKQLTLALGAHDEQAVTSFTTTPPIFKPLLGYPMKAPGFQGFSAAVAPAFLHRCRSS